MRMGIDLGGTKIEGIVLDDDGAEVARRRLMTPQGDYLGTLAAIGGLVEALAEDAALPKSLPVGIGIPGAVSPATGLVKNANSTCLIGNRLDGDLETRLARPVLLANDADCFAISEAVDGSGAGYRTVFGVILGTGVGGGITVAGSLIAGPNAIAGEWGHNPLPWPSEDDGFDERPGPECYCGKRGCIETFLSGPGMARDHELRTGACLQPSDIVAAAYQSDPACVATLSRYEERLSRALATVINVIDPDVIVLGGGMSNIERLYENVPPLLPKWVFSDETATPIVKNRHGDSGGVRGAAWLW